MVDTVGAIDDLNQEQTARLVMDVMHRTIIHYALWFTEIRHQMGMEKALEALSVASEKSLGIQLNRQARCAVAFLELDICAFDRHADQRSLLIAPAHRALQPGVKAGPGDRQHPAHHRHFEL